MKQTRLFDIMATTIEEGTFKLCEVELLKGQDIDNVYHNELLFNDAIVRFYPGTVVQAVEVKGKKKKAEW